jgi:uncharacterized protein
MTARSRAESPRLGVISDTHNQLRPEALAVLRNCETIIHAGDIGSPEILDRLRELAPVYAVRGNNDRDETLLELPETHVLDWREVRILVVHDRKELTAIPPDVDIVISGHSHRPSIKEDDGILFLNPGSAGPRRFHLPVTLATLELNAGGSVAPRIHELVV